MKCPLELPQLTVETVTRRRKAVSTREHLEIAWQRKMERPGGGVGQYIFTGQGDIREVT